MAGDSTKKTLVKQKLVISQNHHNINIYEAPVDNSGRVGRGKQHCSDGDAEATINEEN